MRRFEAKDAEEALALGERIGKLLWPGAVVGLSGPLAAGKTTLAKGIAKGLGVDDEVTSPTFSLICEYSGRLPLYHMDLYRLSSYEEFLDLGAEELICSGGVCLIEWHERVPGALPEEGIRIELDARDDGSREIRIRGKELEELLS